MYLFKNTLAFLRFYGFWLLFFLVNRLFFIGYFWDKIKILEPIAVLKALCWYNIRLDMSTASYILAIPLLCIVLSWMVPALKIAPSYRKAYLQAFIILEVLLTVINFNIYREWGTKISPRVFHALIDAPVAALATAGSAPVCFSLCVGSLLVSIGFFLSSKIIDYNWQLPNLVFWVRPLVSTFIIGLTLLLIRGGWQIAPINRTMTYFSSTPILNHIATNTAWGLMNDFAQGTITNHKVYTFLPQGKAQKLIADLYAAPRDSTVYLLKTNRPNVVFIILESYDADLFESLGGDKGATPSLERLIKHGVLFDNIYASGEVTHKGIVSVLSAFPTQGGAKPIIAKFSKQVKLPLVTQTLQKEGYHALFFFGGDLEFDGTRLYLVSHGLDERYIIDEKSFATKDRGIWGAYDGVVLLKQITCLDQCQEPFVAITVTSTTHVPFKLPKRFHFSGSDANSQFRSTAYYTDSCLNAFFEEAKKHAWYPNTLFVLVADHGRHGSRHAIYKHQRYHIPLLFLGDVIKEECRGIRVHKLGSQTDILATVLAQMSIPYQDYKWSKNLLNPYAKDFAFFSWYEGFGFILPGQVLSWNNLGTEIYRAHPKAAKMLNEYLTIRGKAYMQEVYREYLRY